MDGLAGVCAISCCSVANCAAAGNAAPVKRAKRRPATPGMCFMVFMSWSPVLRARGGEAVVHPASVREDMDLPVEDLDLAERDRRQAAQRGSLPAAAVIGRAVEPAAA